MTTFVHTHAGLNLAVSWIDAFALPGKFNMALTENDKYPLLFNDCATCEPNMRACN